MLKLFGLPFNPLFSLFELFRSTKMRVIVINIIKKIISITQSKLNPNITLSIKPQLDESFIALLKAKSKRITEANPFEFILFLYFFYCFFFSLYTFTIIHFHFVFVCCSCVSTIAITKKIEGYIIYNEKKGRKTKNAQKRYTDIEAIIYITL